ncbi:P-loop containing nucleoside triphosphate hydrolase protein [Abortiporus biennis]|nr:P-loop containing nucleoside triphosphate hydrolase protein [Abortiporus biennis]
MEGATTRRPRFEPDTSDSASPSFAPLPTPSPAPLPPQSNFVLSPASKSLSTSNLPKEFTSPPLMEGLLDSILDTLGPNTRPTPIQALSLKHLVSGIDKGMEDGKWKEYLLASETGSGKSMAYLLPLIQDLKLSELSPSSSSPRTPKTALNPRAIILAPTHELSRQLAGFAKALIHHVKLRVLCASRANVPSISNRDVTASKMSSQYDTEAAESGEFEIFQGQKSRHPVDVLIGTPTKILELVRGRGWNKQHDQEEAKIEDTWGVTKAQANRAPKRKVGQPEVGLENVQWVVVDEADVLFDPDFQESTRMLLADIAQARGHSVPYTPDIQLPEPNSTAVNTPLSPEELPKYPFNLLLTTATIPSYLASYLDRYHPSMTRLASPNLHHLPPTLKTEYESWSGGRKDKDIESRIRKVWWQDAVAAGQAPKGVHPTEEDFEDNIAPQAPSAAPKSKILIFCNKSTKVEELGEFLTNQGIANVALTSTSDSRHRGNNRHLDGFLRVRDGSKSSATTTGDPSKVPHVLITTSLLSRGLDFSPDIKHVFIVDSPRNMIDFLHRAGRSGRAGESGKVVVFGKKSGRGSDRDKDMRKKVGALSA